MHLIARQRADALLGAQYRVAQRMVGEVNPLGPVVGGHHRLIVVHADLLNDDLFLHIEIFVPQAGTQYVGKDIDRLR